MEECNTQGYLPLTMDEFIGLVQQELSVACAVPFTVPVKEIERIIKMSAEWFYKKYEDATEERYLIIPHDAFETAEFKKARTITVPDCVVSIFTLKSLRDNFGTSGMSSFDGTADFGLEKLFLSDASSMGTATENLMYYTLNLYWLDLANHILNHTISYNFNRTSKKLFIGGETPRKDCVAHCYIKLPFEFLMRDELFYRYVVAKAKIQLSRIIGTFAFNLPGGVTINYDLVREEGKEEIEKIEEEIKGDESLDFFFTTGGS